jgi:hypothetical protein
MKKMKCKVTGNFERKETCRKSNGGAMGNSRKEGVGKKKTPSLHRQGAVFQQDDESHFQGFYSPLVFLRIGNRLIFHWFGFFDFIKIC